MVPGTGTCTFCSNLYHHLSVFLFRDDVIKLLLPVFADPRSSMEVLGVTALAAGLISVGSCNLDVTSTILQTLIEKSETDLKVSNGSTF
jgi:hypothetical protein